MKASGQPITNPQALSGAPALSRPALECLPDGIFLCRQTGGDLQIEYANGAFSELLGKPAFQQESLIRLLGTRLEAESREVLLTGLKCGEGMSIVLRGPPSQPQSRFRLALRPLEDGTEWVGSLVSLQASGESPNWARPSDEARQRLDEVTRFMPGVIFQAEVSANQARCTYITEGARDVLGLDVDTITNDFASVRRLVHPDDRDQLQASLVRAASSMERMDHEFRIVRPDGAERWLRVACMPRPGERDAVVFDGQVTDITRHKEIALALSDARSELRQLSRTMPGAIYQIAFGPQFQTRYLYMSETWDEMFGFDASVAKRDAAAFVAILNKEDRANNQPRLEQAVRDFEPFEIEFRIKTPAGIRWIRSAARPVRREAGETVYSAVAVDITELKDAVSALEASQRQLNELTSTIPGAVFQVAVTPSGDASVTYLSDGVEDIYGVKAAELMGSAEKVLSFVPGRDPAQLRERLVAMALKGETLERERPVVSARGESRWLRFNARPVAAEGGVILYNGVVTDITPSKLAETRLAQSEQRLELALESGKLGLFDWHLPSGHMHYNQQFAQTFGTSLEELGHDIHNLTQFEFHGDLNRSRRAQKAHFDGETAEYSCEYRIRRADGEERWLHGRGRVVERDDHNQAVRYVGTVQDVTDRVRADRQLEQQLVFSRMITRLSSEFVNLGANQIDQAIGEALALIGSFSGVDLAYLTEAQASTVPQRTSTWYAADQSGESSPSIFDCSDVPWVRERLMNRETVHLPDLDALPDSAQSDRRALDSAGVRELVALPLYIGEEALGALVLQSKSSRKHWSPGELSLLRIVAEIVSQALDRKRSELALAEAETTVREVTRALPGIVYQLHRDTTGSLDWRFVSGTLIEQLKPARSHGRAASLLDLIDPRDLTRLQVTLSKSAASQRHLELDVRLGSGMRWARISAFPRPLPEGGTLFNGIAIDITDTKLAEAALHASEERFRELYNTTPVMMHSLDRGARIVSVNEHWLTTLGYGRAEVVGRHAEEFLSASSRARVASTAGELRAKGGLREVSLQMVAKSGRSIDVILSANAELDNAGEIVGVKASMVDVTERNRALRALEDSETRYRAIVQDQAELICRFDLHGSIDFMNDACLRFLGHTRDQALTVNWFENMCFLNAESLRKDLQQLRPAAPVGQWELRHAATASGDFWCQWTVRGFFDRDDELVGFQAVGRDVTEVKRLETQIREISQREQERIGHDLHDGLGQELTGLSLMLKSLEKDVASEARNLLPAVGALADTLNQSIATTRALAQGLSPVQLERDGLVGALGHLVEHMGKIYGIPIQLDAPRRVALTDPAVATDLYRIVQEAATNAVRHADAQHITILLQKDEGVLTVEIIDDGSGIKAELPSTNGMGMRIMRYRANIIGAALEIIQPPTGGTCVRCILRQTTIPEQLHTA